MQRQRRFPMAAAFSTAAPPEPGVAVAVENDLTASPCARLP